jgi:hypothetical protein
MNRADSTPAQMYALVFGAVLLFAGIIGFFWEASFDGDARDGVLGILDVNGWHNLVHIASGLAGIALSRRADSARLFARSPSAPSTCWSRSWASSTATMSFG